MKHPVIYVHGKGGSADEAEHYRSLFDECEVVGFDYRAQTPWEAREEFPRFFEQKHANCDSLTLIANSIGAFFSMTSLSARHIDRALFISPVVDMEQLITDMMERANVTEDELRARKEIPIGFGETLSWDWLCDVRNHPVQWTVPTRILYGGRDFLTSPETMTAFAVRIGAPLTVMPRGEHWFHTPEQMAFLDRWIRESSPCH
ncbi:MAG: alpha/beta hydrolase [Lentisphaeria bacterium]|nr:alpha/beta hydrolase [Lentisphaeria bacterium]